MQKSKTTNLNLSKNDSEKGRQPTTNDLLKKLYTLTKNRSKAFKHIVKIHKNVFTEIHKGLITFQSQKVDIGKQINSYKPENMLKMDEQLMLQCVSIHNLFTGKQGQQLKYGINQQKHHKIQSIIEQRMKSKQNQQKSLSKKQNQYMQKVKQYQKQKQFYDRKKKQQAQKKQEILKQQKQKMVREKQQQIERQKSQKKKKLQQGLKQMQEKRKQRLETIKQLALQSKRSSSMKALGQHTVPKYIELQKEYLQKQRKKAEQFRQQQLKKRQSMQLKIDQIKNHERQYIEKMKAKFTSSNNKNSTQKQGKNMDAESIKVRSQFVTIKFRDQQEEQRYRDKAMRRKQFQSKLRSIPINIDVNKRKQKQIEIDKAVNKQKYILLGKRNLNDDIIYKEFKNFQINVDAKIIGNNYLNQIKLAPKAPKSERISKERSQGSLSQKPQKIQYTNYLQELRLNNKIHRKSQKKFSQTAELLKMVEKSKNILKKSNQQNIKIYESPSKFTVRENRQKIFSDPSTKSLSTQLKNQASKSITEKIVQYERKVFKKVNDLKKISQYDDSLKNQHQIDELYSKVLQAKLNSINSV